MQSFSAEPPMGCVGREQWVAVFPLYYRRRSLGGSNRSTNLPPHRPPCVANEPARPPAGNRGPCHIYLGTHRGSEPSSQSEPSSGGGALAQIRNRAPAYPRRPAR